MKNIAKGIYSIYVMLIFLVMLLPSFPVFIIVYFFPIKIRDKIAHFMLRFYSHFWCYMTGIFPRIYHREKIDFCQSYIITANHQCYWDPVQMYTSLNHFFKGVGKIEINKAPMFGLLYQMAVIAVDRSSASKSASTYRNMVRYLRSNWSILIFPEATFPQPAQSKLLAFKKGAFALAQQENKDILPMLFVDTAKRMPSDSFFRFTPGYLTTVFLPPIPVAQFEEEIQLRKFAQEYMQACLDFCRENGGEGTWKFAQEYLFEKNNIIVNSEIIRNILDWKVLHESIYFEDEGTLRDIYVKNTNVEDYQNYVNHLHKNYKIEWFNPRTNSTHDKINFDCVLQEWNMNHENRMSSSLIIKLNGINIHSLFIDLSEIENYIDPIEIKNIENHLVILKFMKDLSNALNKDVILTPENLKEYPLIEVSNGELIYLGGDKYSITNVR